MGIFKRNPRCISEIREKTYSWQMIATASERLAHASLYIRHAKGASIAEIQAANLLLRLSIEIIKEDTDRSYR